MRSPLARRRLSRPLGPPAACRKATTGRSMADPSASRARALLASCVRLGVGGSAPVDGARRRQIYIFGNAVLGADHARLGFPRRQASRCRSGARLVLGRKVQECPYRCLSRLRTVCCGQFFLCLRRWAVTTCCQLQPINVALQIKAFFFL
jgi:hypothetical protein